jgi:hypothetical protein
MSYSLQSEVMSRAGELRRQGLDASDALSTAWSEVDGSESNPVSSGTAGNFLMLSTIGYIVWCSIKYAKSKVWSWQPWKAIPATNRRIPSATVAVARREQSLPVDERIINTGQIGDVYPAHRLPGTNHRDDEPISVIMP